ncbi:MAG: hypothetical protein N3G20_01210 [Verrucomicrobiae bacterium]|nr:hypothetical protein [Verrucomicrobiae bacterium]
MRKLILKVRETVFPSREEIADKFGSFPWLEKLVLVFLYDKRFRWAIFGLVLGGVGLMFALLPVWRSTPAGFEPVYRVKLLDMWQARALRRTALSELAEGRTHVGLMTMRTAVSNNPGDLDLVREFVQMIIQHGDPARHAHLAVQNGLWLLQLSNTNVAELELVAGLFEKFYLDEFVVELLKGVEDRLSPELEKAYARSLFMSRRPAEFAARWAKLQTRGGVTNDARLRLVHSAYLAGWTDGASARTGQEALDNAKADRDLAPLAHRLQLIVSEQKGDIESYGKSLDELVHMRAAGLGDHVVYWRLLTESGSREKAVELARSNVDAPRTGDEAILLARALYELGLADEARQVLYKYARHFVLADHLWLSLGNLLESMGEWDELGKIALEMRDETNPLRNDLLCLSLYYEGVSELKRHREPAAEAAFGKAAQTPCENEAILLRVAQGMSGLGYWNHAQQLLLRNQRVAETNATYWELLGKVSYNLRDFPTLVHSSIKVHSLRPDDPVALQNHAAALLSMRTMPKEAIALTLELYRRYPNNPGAILNHAAALTQNRRFEEAQRLLQSLDPMRLSDEDRTGYYLVLMEILVEQGDYSGAARAAERVDRRYMFPPDAEWYEKMIERIRGNGSQFSGRVGGS